MEERRQQDARFEEFLAKFFKLDAAVQRLIEHEASDKPKYDDWHKDTSKRLVELEKLWGEFKISAVRDLADLDRDRSQKRQADEVVNGKLTKLDDQQRKTERVIVWTSGAVTIIVSIVVIIVNLILRKL